MTLLTRSVKGIGLAILDQSRHRGHDLWRDLRFFYHQISDDDAPVLFDVGANVGQTAEAMAKAFPNGRIFSFEPCSGPYAQLKRKVSRFRNVESIPMGLGDSPGKRRIRLQEHSTTNSLLQPIDDDEKAEEIVITTADQFASDRQIDRLFLLKTDTEGFDVNVLQGGQGLLLGKKIDYVLVEVCFFRKMALPQTDFMAAADFLQGLGYHLCHLYETVYATKGGAILWCNALFTCL